MDEITLLKRSDDLLLDTMCHLNGFVGRAAADECAADWELESMVKAADIVGMIHGSIGRRVLDFVEHGDRCRADADQSPTTADAPRADEGAPSEGEDDRRWLPNDDAIDAIFETLESIPGVRRMGEGDEVPSGCVGLAIPSAAALRAETDIVDEALARQ